MCFELPPLSPYAMRERARVRGDTAPLVPLATSSEIRLRPPSRPLAHGIHAAPLVTSFDPGWNMIPCHRLGRDALRGAFDAGSLWACM